MFPTGEFIIGRVIKAMNNSWHPDCFCCDICHKVLADIGFVKNAGRWVFTLSTISDHDENEMIVGTDLEVMVPRVCLLLLLRWSN